ncbi:MAG: carbamoyltransferase HypF [Rubripirellula sp.]
MSGPDTESEVRRLRLLLAGQVQGMGFRPFVWKLANALGLTGFVHNTPEGVVLEVQGDTRKLEAFRNSLNVDTPALVQIRKVSESVIPTCLSDKFEIRQSRETNEHGDGPFVLPDLAMCGDCRRELNDPSDRRYRYPFINCTACGPRYTIIKDVPYDRPQTTMRSFAMCDACEREYHDPANRRFHAQPIACSRCGPQICFTRDQSSTPLRTNAVGVQALDAYRLSIERGEVVAVKGIGGFHFICDAYNSNAVERLRRRKGRHSKPFAIMIRSLDVAKAFAVMTPVEQQALEGDAAPIVLLQQICDSTVDSRHHDMLERIAPGTGSVGVLLPYAPLHELLIEPFEALVVTSANLSEEPITSSNDVALTGLGTVADACLLHDRDIEVACDDSVIRFIDDSPSPIRLGRGLSPKVLSLGSDGPTVLAIGGDLKSAFCFARGRHAYLSPHVGDLSAANTMQRLSRDVTHFERMFRLRPAVVATDLHPAYHSRTLAIEYAEQRGLPLVGIQHHEAHAWSLIAEKSVDEEEAEMIACCFDGTGYGGNESIWGGEFFLVDPKGTRHFAQLDPVSLPGGDTCARKPARSGLAYLFHAGVDWRRDLPPVDITSEEELRVIRQQLHRNVNCVPCSSVGRLFDAVASLTGICQESSYEAEAAVRLEAAASRSNEAWIPAEGLFQWQQREVLTVTHDRLIRWLAAPETRQLQTDDLAAAFHHSVAKMVAQVCVVARSQSGIERVGLTGGVFQNQLLVQSTRRALHLEGFDVWTHECVPANDGGLALGQAILARQRIQRNR